MKCNRAEMQARYWPAPSKEHRPAEASSISAESSQSRRRQMLHSFWGGRSAGLYGAEGPAPPASSASSSHITWKAALRPAVLASSSTTPRALSTFLRI